MKRFRIFAETLVITTFLLAGSSIGFAQNKAQSAMAESFAGQHPRVLMLEADKAFKSGRAEDAAFLFYLGQLRWNVLIKAKPDAKDDDPTLSLDAINQSVGRPINEMMLQDPGLMAMVLRNVRAQEVAAPDRFTPIAEHADIWQNEFSQFDAFIDYVDKQAAANQSHRGADPVMESEEKPKP